MECVWRTAFDLFCQTGNYAYKLFLFIWDPNFQGDLQQAFRFAWKTAAGLKLNTYFRCVKTERMTSVSCFAGCIDSLNTRGMLHSLCSGCAQLKQVCRLLKPQQKKITAGEMPFVCVGNVKYSSGVQMKGKQVKFRPLTGNRKWGSCWLLPY